MLQLITSMNPEAIQWSSIFFFSIAPSLQLETYINYLQPMLAQITVLSDSLEVD
jgi:hypothetical protein